MFTSIFVPTTIPVFTLERDAEGVLMLNNVILNTIESLRTVA